MSESDFLLLACRILLCSAIAIPAGLPSSRAAELRTAEPLEPTGSRLVTKEVRKPSTVRSIALLEEAMKVRADLDMTRAKALESRVALNGFAAHKFCPARAADFL